MTAATSRHCQTCCLLLPQYRAVACLAAVPARMFVYILIFTELQSCHNVRVPANRAGFGPSCREKKLMCGLAGFDLGVRVFT